MFQVNTTIHVDYTNFLVDTLFVRPTTTPSAATTTTTTTAIPATTMSVNNTLTTPSSNISFVVEISNSSQIETMPVFLSTTTQQPAQSVTQQVTPEHQQQLPLPKSVNISNQNISFKQFQSNQNELNFTIVQEISINTKTLIRLVTVLLILVAILILMLFFLLYTLVLRLFNKKDFTLFKNEEV